MPIIPDMKIVRENLLPFEPEIFEAYHGAFQDFLSIPLLLNTRSRTTIINDRAVQRAKDLLSEKGVIINEKYESGSFKVNDIVLFKFKQVDILGLSRSFPTPRANAYYNHNEENQFWPPIHRVEIGYVWNILSDEIPIYVVGRDGGDIAWKYQIMSDSIPLYQPVLPFPEPPTPSTPPSDIVKPLDNVLPFNKKEDKGK